MSIYKDKLYKLPRLYINNDISKDSEINLNSDQSHYLKNVIRRNIGDHIRIFNGKDGEWISEIISLNKKSCSISLLDKIKEQSNVVGEFHLIFAPIKKNRMDFIIEKAVELGVTHLHPVITKNTENRKVNISRIEKQILEATEQCERIDIARLLEIDDLYNVLNRFSDINIIAAVERSDGVDIKKIENSGDIAYLVGPEGGFVSEEVEWVNNKSNVIAVSLGENILRAETAIIYGVSILKI